MRGSLAPMGAARPPPAAHGWRRDPVPAWRPAGHPGCGEGEGPRRAEVWPCPCPCHHCSSAADGTSTPSGPGRRDPWLPPHAPLPRGRGLPAGRQARESPPFPVTCHLTLNKHENTSGQGFLRNLCGASEERREGLLHPQLRGPAPPPPPRAVSEAPPRSRPAHPAWAAARPDVPDENPLPPGSRPTAGVRPTGRLASGVCRGPVPGWVRMCLPNQSGRDRRPAAGQGPAGAAGAEQRGRQGLSRTRGPLTREHGPGAWPGTLCRLQGPRRAPLVRSLPRLLNGAF